MRAYHIIDVKILFTTIITFINICIELFRYALGSVKVNELSFSTIEEIVTFYMKEELMLYSGGFPTGSTRLTDTPPK
jgi:hypothetical protein